MRDVSITGATFVAAWIAHATIVFALFFAGSVYAVVNPQSEKDDSPIALACRVVSVATQDQGGATNVSARCEVAYVIRSTIDLRRGDLVAIRYSVKNDDNGVRDMPKIPGSAPASDPPGICEGQIVTAYLKPAKSADGDVYFVPNIGFFPFEIAPSQACRSPERPIPPR